MLKTPFASVIVPTLGRKSLEKSLLSLCGQTIENWSAFVMFDGLSPVIPLRERRVTFLSCPKQPGAGGVRNLAIAHAIKYRPKWISFLDDDDVWKPTYLEKLKGYGEDYDVVIFSRRTLGNRIIPRKNSRLQDIRFGNVGITYSVRSSFLVNNSLKFDSRARGEDYWLLADCKSHGANIRVTNDIQYFCGGRSRWGKRGQLAKKIGMV